MDKMQDTPTRRRLVAANKERMSIECGGESKRSLEAVKAEIAQLRDQIEAEDLAELVQRRTTLRVALVQADIDRETARALAQEADKHYRDLLSETANVEVTLSHKRAVRAAEVAA